LNSCMRVPVLLRAALCVSAAFLLVGCLSSRSGTSFLQWDLQEGLRQLRRPLPGPMAALYRLRVGSTSTLRMALLAEGEWGRMTISESFGSTLSITAWDVDQPARVLDMRHGCRIAGSALEGMPGISRIPMRRLPLLLGGRLPVEEGDRIDAGENGELIVDAASWHAVIRLEPDPWRVVEIRSGDFVITLADHSLSVPGRIETRDPEGRRIRLDLLRLKWEIARRPEALPELPLCGEEHLEH